MTEAATKLPVKSESKSALTPLHPWYPLESMWREFDRMLDDFNHGFWYPRFARSLFDYEPFGRLGHANTLPVDIADKDGAYEITAELPGIDEKDVEVSVSNDGLSIKAEKKGEKEEQKMGYVVSERRYGTFERRFGIPAGVDTDKISASFKKGVLTVTLPKTTEALKQEKKIAVKTL